MLPILQNQPAADFEGRPDGAQAHAAVRYIKSMGQLAVILARAISSYQPHGKDSLYPFAATLIIHESFPRY